MTQATAEVLLSFIDMIDGDLYRHLDTMEKSKVDTIVLGKKEIHALRLLSKECVRLLQREVKDKQLSQ